jgi:hypothetical protein
MVRVYVRFPEVEVNANSFKRHDCIDAIHDFVDNLSWKRMVVSTVA